MTRTELFLGLGVALTVAFVLPSCGDDDGDKSGGDDQGLGGEGDAPAQGGSTAGRAGSAGRSAQGGGTGGGVQQDVPCGDEVCTGRTLPGYPGIPACCADEGASQCGLDTSLLTMFGAEPTRSCEPLDQPGELDEDCPDSPPFQQGSITLPPFRGCCNAETGACGYKIDRALEVIQIGLGCVDATPFLDGAEPAPCDPSSGTGGNGAGGNGAGGNGAGGSAE